MSNEDLPFLSSISSGSHASTKLKQHGGSFSSSLSAAKHIDQVGLEKRTFEK